MGVGVGTTRWFHRAPLLVALLAVACKRSPLPSPAPSSAASARSAASGSAAASASVAPLAPSCAEWTVEESRAKGSLEHWCQQFGPCPRSLQEGIARVPGLFPNIEARGRQRVLSAGFLGGYRYTFELDRLVGAELWDDMSFGVCAERGVVTYTAGLMLPWSPPGTSCGVVPGRDYASGEPCRCHLELKVPTLENGNRGPLLRTSLECLYEAGVAARLCEPTLQLQRERMAQQEANAKGHAEIAAGMRRARGAGRVSASERSSLEESKFRASERTKCGDTVIISPYRRASVECRYDGAGSLTGLRWGKRYESEGFTACQR